tara:strand:+ start:419 stop:664 length:246 start_codon:yes stop_codon:yes gene_type:complete
MRLINKIKPSVLKALETQVKPRFTTSYEKIIASLSKVDRYQELTVDDTYNLYTFLPTEMQPNGILDIYWGDYIMQDKYIIK